MYDWKKILNFTTSGIYFNIFFQSSTPGKKLFKTFFQIVGSYLKSMNVNQAWLSKSIGKYYSWLWYHSKNIEFITRGLRPLVINSIFFLVITITTRNIFQYFLTAMHDSTNTFCQLHGNLPKLHFKKYAHLRVQWIIYL